MFDNLVQSAVFPAIKEVITAADNALEGVKTRLQAQLAGPDHITALAAKAQLDAIAAWEPAFQDIVKNLKVSEEKTASSVNQLRSR